MGRLDVNLTDIHDVNAALLRGDLIPETKTEIQEKSTIAIAEDKTNQTITVFSPSLLANSSDVEYYTYWGRSMMSERTYVINNDTQYQTISSGTNAKPVAQALFDLTLMGLSSVAPPLELVSTGISVLQMFLDIASANTVVATAKDYVQLLIRYDLATQRTYTKSGEIWLLGLTSYKVYITTTTCRQKYYNVDGAVTTGVEKEFSNGHYVTLKSLYYDNPWETASQFIGNPLYVYVKAKAGNLTITLS